MHKPLHGLMRYARPQLPPGENERLVAHYQQTRCVDTLETLILCNLGLIGRGMRKAGVRPDQYDEYLSHALETFIRATQLFDPTKARFSTYCIRSVQRNLYRLRTQKGPIKAPGGADLARLTPEVVELARRARETRSLPSAFDATLSREPSPLDRLIAAEELESSRNEMVEHLGTLPRWLASALFVRMTHPEIPPSKSGLNRSSPSAQLEEERHQRRPKAKMK